MADLSKLLDTTQVTDVKSRVASVDDVLSSKTETNKNKVFSFYDTTQIVKPLSSLPIKEKNTKELALVSDDSLIAINSKVDYEINTDEDLEKAFIDISGNLKDLDRPVKFESSFTSSDILSTIPSVDTKETISTNVMSKAKMDELLQIKQNNRHLSNKLYSKSVTTTSDYNFNDKVDFSIDVKKVSDSNVSLLENVDNNLKFFSSDDVSMNHFKDLSMDAVGILQDSYKNAFSNIATDCDGLMGIYGCFFMEINALFASFNGLLNMSLGFNNSSLLSDLLDCFEIASDALKDVKNITKTGNAISQNGSYSIVDKFLEHSDKSKVNFSSVLTNTFKNAKTKAKENELPYDKDEVENEYSLVKVKYSINDDDELKKKMRTTKIHDDTILNHESVYDIHKIQKEHNLSNIIMTQDENDAEYHNLLKNQPLVLFA